MTNTQCYFLALLSRNISVGKQTPDNNSDHSFGGINVILCGDLHQLPPVAAAKSEALFYPANLAKDSVEAQVGCMIYEEFTTVVILREQWRTTDQPWRDFLRHLRHGHVPEEDVRMLRTLLITGPNNTPTDFLKAPWSDVALVMPRHAVMQKFGMRPQLGSTASRRVGNYLFVRQKILTRADHSR